MGRVLTNATSVAYAIQESFDVLGASPEWKLLEPNGITKATPDLTKITRNPISKDRQRRKGSTVGVDSGFEYEADLTLDSFVDWIEGFVFATATNSDMLFRGANAGASGYTIPAATAAQAAKFQFTSGGPISLVYAAGYLTDANNGLKPLSADLASTDTTLQVAGLSTETAPANAEVVVAGIRAEAGDLALAVSSGVGTLSSGNGASVNPIDFTTLGLTIGQFVHVGGLTSANQFGSTAAADGTRSLGYGRVRSIAAGAITLDKLSTGLVASDGTNDGIGGTEIPVDLLFSRFIRNVSTDSSEFLERYFQVEYGWENLYETDPPTPVADPDGFEYAVNNLANELSWIMALRNKATLTAAFVGTDTEPPVDNSGRKTNADTPREPLFTAAYNTSTDFVRLRITDVDETGLTTDFKDLTIKLANGVTPENVLGLIGARFLNFGNFLVDMETSVLFTSPEIPNRIRNSTTVSMDWIVSNDDGAILSDIPSMDLGNGGRDLPVNETVKINLTGEAFKDPELGYTFSASLLPIVP